MGISTAAHQPARLVERTLEEPRERVLAPSEIEAIGKALAAHDHPFTVAAIRFLMLTGWRNGEALAMEWADVNFETGEIVLASTKTGRAVRTVDAMALAAIADLPRINRVPGVFAGLTYASLRRHWQIVCEAAGVPDCRLHDVRRTVATTMAAAGMSAFILRDLMGHKTSGYGESVRPGGLGAARGASRYGVPHGRHDGRESRRNRGVTPTSLIVAIVSIK